MIDCFRVPILNNVKNEYELAEQKNPNYCTERQKDFLMQLVKTIPGGQCLLIAGRMETDINTLPLIIKTNKIEMIALTVLLEIDIAIKVKIEASASMIAVIQIRSIPKLGKDICMN